MADFIKISSVVQNQKNAYLHLFISKCFDCCWTLAITSYQNYRCRGLGLKLLSLAKQDYGTEVVINMARGKLLNSLNALRHKVCSGDIIFQAAKGPELKLLGLLFRKLRKSILVQEDFSQNNSGMVYYRKALIFQTCLERTISGFGHYASTELLHNCSKDFPPLRSIKVQSTSMSKSIDGNLVAEISDPLSTTNENISDYAIAEWLLTEMIDSSNSVMS
ncbi:hypothetical protein VNO77_14766 [Canavalia gladiata]|uniref:Uncharacterized protein n=1 Tax=Canavalia gladiata TaxID=3824 RepID=A0AAN9M3R7_CANGL